MQKQYDASSQGKKRSARAARASANDFERFQVQIAKKERNTKRKAA